MKYALLGASGLVVSKLSFGAMTLGDTWKGALARADQTQTNTLVGAALDQGVNFYDTADIYHSGQSERLLGQALGDRRKDVVVATKVGMRVGKELSETGLSARHIHLSIDGSLKRLGTDWVDVYICHRPDPLTPLQETLVALDQIVRAGKVRYLGFSNWPAWLAAKAVEMQKARGLARFVTGQMYYSLVGRDIEHEFLPLFEDAGIGIMVWSPLAGGFLSGKYTRENPTGGGGRLTQMDILPIDREKGYAIVEVLGGIAKARDTTVAAVALAWLADRPTVSTVIMGFGSQKQMSDNLAASDLTLSAEERAKLDEISAPALPYPQNFIARFHGDPATSAVRG